jgi:hypothetical protein
MFKQGTVLFKILALICLATFTSLFVCLELHRERSRDAVGLGLSEPGRLLSMSGDYREPRLQGVRLNPDNPLVLDFLIDTGDERNVSRSDLMRMVNYFMAGLTIPKDKLWVNLSPYEADRIVEDSVKDTDMGRDLLACDYVLKQLAGSLTHPDTPTGAAYWRQVAAENSALGKIWIKPDMAQVYQDTNANVTIITGASLKIETEDESQ